MKTAEEIFEFEMPIDWDNSEKTKRAIIRAMKRYAKEVAELALMKASNNARIVTPYHRGREGESEIVKSSIYNTEIELP
jgi:hypothetical protein